MAYRSVRWALLAVTVVSHQSPVVSHRPPLVSQSLQPSTDDRRLSTDPVIVVETTKGTFSFETYPNEAPKTVAHIVELVQAGFYDNQRVHRAIPVFLVQWGDPRSRDPGRQAEWGRGDAASSGKAIGVAEMSRKRLHIQGAVGVASPTGHPQLADSQLYITLARRPDLDGRYTVFGRVAEGEDVPARLEVGDVIRRMYVRK